MQKRSVMGAKVCATQRQSHILSSIYSKQKHCSSFPLNGPMVRNIFLLKFPQPFTIVYRVWKEKQLIKCVRCRCNRIIMKTTHNGLHENTK